MEEEERREREGERGGEGGERREGREGREGCTNQDSGEKTRGGRKERHEGRGEEREKEGRHL